MKANLKHSYSGIMDKSSSEFQHMLEINRLTEKISFEIFRKSKKEHEETKKAISEYPNKNHRPIRSPKPQLQS